MNLKKAVISSVIYGFILPFLFGSCEYIKLKKNEEEKKATAVARAGEHFLYLEDLQKIIPANLSEEDSIRLNNQYIKGWIKQELLLQKAESIPEIDQKSITKQMNEYRLSLVTYELEKFHVKNNLDTLISEEEINQYYNEKKESFVLRNNIVLAQYVKVPQNAKDLGKLRRYLNSTDSADYASLKQYCYDQAIDYMLEDSTWIDFGDLLSNMPITVTNQKSFLKTTRYFAKNYEGNKHIINIKEYKLKGEIPPVEYVKDIIKNRIIHNKKARLIKKFKEDIFINARANNEFEIF